MKNQTKWVNLSSKEFESRKYENPEGYRGGIYLKPPTGMWFSLPSDNEFASEWGNYLEYNNSMQKYVIGEDGQTNITTVELKDSCYMVNLEEWTDDIAEIVRTTDRTANNDEKRKRLLERIRQKTGRDDINYLVFSLKEDDFPGIIDIYVNNILTEEENVVYRREKLDQGFHKIDESLAAVWLTDYFSGLVNYETIDGYDMPSLALFDTDCAEVLSREKRKIFEREKQKDPSEEILQIGRISIPKNVYEELQANSKKFEKRIFGEEDDGR